MLTASAIVNLSIASLPDGTSVAITTIPQVVEFPPRILNGRANGMTLTWLAVFKEFPLIPSYQGTTYPSLH